MFHTYRCRLAIYGACGASELFLGCSLLLIDYLVEPLAGAGFACPIRIEDDAHFVGDARVPMSVGVDDQIGDCQQATVFIDFMGIGGWYGGVVDVAHDAFDVCDGCLVFEGGEGLWCGVWVVDFHVVSVEHEVPVATHIPFLFFLCQYGVNATCI